MYQKQNWLLPHPRSLPSPVLSTSHTQPYNPFSTHAQNLGTSGKSKELWKLLKSACEHNFKKCLFLAHLFSHCSLPHFVTSISDPHSTFASKSVEHFPFVHLNWLEVLVNYHFLRVWRSDYFLLFHMAVNPLIKGDGKWIIKLMPFSYFR